MHSRTVLPALLLLAVACGPKDAGAPESAANAAASGAGSVEEDLADVSSYRLTMDKVDRYFEAQRNIARRVKDMSPEDRAPLERMESSANASLDDMARRIDSHPAMREAVREAGFSAREFATFTMAMVQAAMASSVLEMRPNDDQDSLAREMKASMENIRFLREHEAEITQRQEALEAEFREAGVGAES